MGQPLIVVTGASQGIGRAVAVAFAAAGHPLLLIARHAGDIPDLQGHPHHWAEADVADYPALAAAVADGETRFGPVGCLVNNAGFIHIGDFAERPAQDMDYEIDVLFKGVVHGCRAVLPGMRARRTGTIVNISSIGDRRPGPSGETYHASKAAVRSLSESMQQAEAEHGIRVVNIAPGLVRTNIHAGMGISMEAYMTMVGKVELIDPGRIADIVMFCWRQPQSVCIRDIVVMPTNSAF